jgi:hypothetical protein
VAKAVQGSMTYGLYSKRERVKLRAAIDKLRKRTGRAAPKEEAGVDPKGSDIEQSLKTSRFDPR